MIFKPSRQLKFLRLFFHIQIILVGTLIFFVSNSGILNGRDAFSHDAMMWVGKFDYFLMSIKSGVFPYWDRFTHLGTPFYQNIQISGYLDPMTYIGSIPTLIFDRSTFLSHHFFYLLRLVIFLIGAYLFIAKITKDTSASLVAMFVLAFTIGPLTYRQNGLMHSAYLTPLILYFWLRFLDSLESLEIPSMIPLSICTLLTGITLSIYVPSYFIFTFIFFNIGLFVFSIYKISIFKKLFFFRKITFFLPIFILLLLGFSAPGFVLMKETSATGELFPILRLNHSLGFVELSEPLLNQSLLTYDSLKNLNFFHGSFEGLTNYLQFIFPGIWKSYTIQSNQTFAEIFLGIGLIGFLLLTMSFIYFRTKWFLFVIFQFLSIGLVCTNPLLVGAPNKIQEILIFVFPFLKLINSYALFGIEFQLYSALALALSLGKLRIFQRWISGQPKIRRNSITCLFLFLIIRWFFIMTSSAYQFDRVTELVSSLLLVLFFFLFFTIRNYFDFKISHQHSNVRFSVFMLLTSILIMFELGFYNFRLNNLATDSPDPWKQLYQNRRHYVSDILNQKPEASYFRDSFTPTTIPYYPLLMRTKSWLPKLYFGGSGSFFSTKRYFQFISQLSPERQFELSAVDTPILHFYEHSQVLHKSHENILAELSGADFNPRNFLILENFSESTSTAKLNKSEVISKHLFKPIPWLQNLPYENFVKELFAKQEVNFWSKSRQEAMDLLKNGPSPVRIISESPNEVEIAVQNSAGGYIFFNDGWSKYWSAKVNGMPAPIEIANFNFKAVKIEPGDNSVTFVYDPYPYRYGLYIYWISFGMTLLICVILFLMSWKRSDKIRV